MTRKLLLGGVALVAGLLPLTASGGEVASYSAVTQERLSNPEPGNWILSPDL